MDISIKFVKNIPIDEVTPVTLKDMGFSFDAPIFDAKKYADYSDNNILSSFYRKTSDIEDFYGSKFDKKYIYAILNSVSKEDAFSSICNEVEYTGLTQYEIMLYLVTRSLFDIDRSLAEQLLAAFLYLIETLIPRNIQDLFYMIGLDTNGAYWTFFDIAVEKMGLETYRNHNHNSFGQVKNYPMDRLKEMVRSGASLQEIYDTTCATKKMISEAIQAIEGYGSKGERLIESYLLDMDLVYEREVYFQDFKTITGADFDGRFDFIIYKKKKPYYAIEFDGEQHFKYIEMFHGNEEGFLIQQYRDKTKNIYCERKQIGMLRIPYNKINSAKKLIKGLIR